MLSLYVQYTKGMTDITYRVFDHLPTFIQEKNKVTISTVFHFYYITITQCQAVLITKPHWVNMVFNIL